MAETLWIDYAWVHKDPTAIKAASYSGVARYLSHDPTKDITPAEVEALHAADLSIVIVWETTAARATQGYAAGVADRAEAESRAAHLGYPKHCPIFYAVDSNVPVASVFAYFQGVNSGNVYPVGVYGSIYVVDGIHERALAAYFWQTEAWSGTTVSANAHLYQRVKATRNLAGGGYDEDVVLKSFPAWGNSVVQPALPSWYHRELAYPTTLLKDPGNLGRNWQGLVYQAGPDVGIVQRKVGAHVDDWYGPNTATRVKGWQQARGLKPDGIVGPITATRMGE